MEAAAYLSLLSFQAQSDSKTRFFERLGLDPGDATHKRVYALMKVRSSVAIEVCRPSNSFCRPRLPMVVAVC